MKHQPFHDAGGVLEITQAKGAGQTETTTGYVFAVSRHRGAKGYVFDHYSLLLEGHDYRGDCTYRRVNRETQAAFHAVSEGKTDTEKLQRWAAAVRGCANLGDRYSHGLVAVFQESLSKQELQDFCLSAAELLSPSASERSDLEALGPARACNDNGSWKVKFGTAPLNNAPSLIVSPYPYTPRSSQKLGENDPHPGQMYHEWYTSTKEPFHPNAAAGDASRGVHEHHKEYAAPGVVGAHLLCHYLMYTETLDLIRP